MEEDEIERWVTTYALSSGISKKRGVIVGHYFRYGGRNLVNKDCGLVKTGYHHATFSKAVAHAEKLRKKKVASLKKQLARMKSLRFKEPVDGE